LDTGGQDIGARPSRVHVGALDGLRGLAVLGVVAFHLAALDGGDRDGLLHGGWLGVDVFFTLSGYLITSLLLDEAGRTGRIDLRGFWRRRVRRLQPAALVAVACIVATAAWWAPAGAAGAVRSDALTSLAGVANWHQLLAHRSYAAGPMVSGFEHFWSLAVEEQFYLVWPLLVAGLVRLGRGRAAVLGAALAGTALSWALLLSADLQHGYLRTDTRMGSVLVGAALAAVLPLGRKPRAAGRLAATSAVAGLLATAVLWAAAGWPPHLPLGGVLVVQALATAAVIAGVVAAPSSAPARLLAVRPLAGIGKVSYGIYLWHWPVFVVCTPARLGTGWAATTTIRLLAVAALTGASWLLVERPVRLGHVLRRTRLALPAAGVLVAGVALVAVHAVDPSPAWAKADGRLLRGSRPVVAVAPDGTPPRRVLVVGDSIPTSLMAGAAVPGFLVGSGHLLDQLAERGIEAWGGTVTGCPVVDQRIVIDGRTWDCPATLRDLFPRLMAEARPDLVVWYDRQDAYPALRADGTFDTSLAGLQRRLTAGVDWFHARGARVLFVSPGPNRDGFDAAAPRGSSHRSMALLDRALAHVAGTRPDAVVGIVRMDDLLCSGRMDRCHDRLPGGGYYRPDDGIHFGPAGALAAGDWLADRIAAVKLPARP
jgi:peptidoglycan/LPS O-acetylase OafA/YrhL